MNAYNERMILRGFSGALIALALAVPGVAFAADLSASPMVIDGKGKPREIMTYSVRLTNNSSRLLTVYPWVTNYTATSGAEEMPDLTRADLSTSLANWIEMTRGVITLEPGESKDIPVLIQVSLSATPGTRHALLRFAHGINRIDAESNVAGTLTVPVNIEVVDDAKEMLQLRTFAPEKQWFTSSDARFSFALENIGNRGVVPRGKIRIFDRRGMEIASVEANDGGEKLEPSATALLGAVWTADGKFGRYKAMLDLSYGDGRRTIQDTVFFWVIPWQKLLGLFLSLTIISVIIAVLIQSRGSARPSYAAERASSESVAARAYDDDGASVRPSRLERFKKFIRRFTSVSNPVPMEEMTEAVPEKRARTRVYDSVNLSSALSGQSAYPSGAIRLEARKRDEPNPDHVVDLRNTP